MRSWRGLMPALTVSATLVAPALAVDPPGTGLSGTAFLQLRLRVESVDEAAFQEDATATTLRSRLAWTSARNRGWQAAVLESTQPQFDLALGRQRLVLDNQRFVANVGWRQNEQTVDGAVLRRHPAHKGGFTLAWLTNVNRVFESRSGTQAANWPGDTAIVHGKSDCGRLGTLSVFWHGLDFDNAASSSVSTAGLFWTDFARPGGGWQLPCRVSLASQRDCAVNVTDHSATYRQLEFGLARGPATLRAGLESPSGDATRPACSVQKALTTLHAFQDWADKLRTMPSQGVEDRYVTLEAIFHGTQAPVSWHELRAEATGRRFSHASNLSALRKLGTRDELPGDLADYTADSFATDTRKAWLMFTATL